MAVIQLDSRFSLALTLERGQGRATMNDCDIPKAPFLLAGQRRSQGARLIEPGMPCQQSIISLPCPRFSHEG